MKKSRYLIPAIALFGLINAQNAEAITAKKFVCENPPASAPTALPFIGSNSKDSAKAWAAAIKVATNWAAHYCGGEAAIYSMDVGDPYAANFNPTFSSEANPSTGFSIRSLGLTAKYCCIRYVK